MPCRPKPYTDADVQNLVGVARDLQHRGQEAKKAAPLLAPVKAWSVWPDLDAALAPFLTDPDAELIEAVKRIRADVRFPVDQSTRDIIAAVREYDKARA